MYVRMYLCTYVHKFSGNIIITMMYVCMYMHTYDDILFVSQSVCYIEVQYTNVIDARMFTLISCMRVYTYVLTYVCVCFNIGIGC